MAACLCAWSWCASQHRADECDSRGLPLTPNTTNILGRSQLLLGLKHHNLTAYLDFRKSKHERVVMVSEWWTDSLDQHISSGCYGTERAQSLLARQVLSGLAFLNCHGIVHRNLSPENILLGPEGRVQLHDWGLYYMSNSGREVAFPIGYPRYLAPEVLMSSPHSSSPSSCKADVWSLGVILLELHMGKRVYGDLSARNGLSSLLKRLLLLAHNSYRNSTAPLVSLLETHSARDMSRSALLTEFLESCLSGLPSQRPSPQALLDHAFLRQHPPAPPVHQSEYVFLESPFSSLLRCSQLTPPSPEATGSCDHLMERPIRELYYLWSLAGGDPEAELRRSGIIVPSPPVSLLPRLVPVGSGESLGAPRDRLSVYNRTRLPLSLDQLRTRLESKSTEHYYPLEETESAGESSHESSRLPLAIRESDVDYQLSRVVLFARLLESYPHSRPRLLKEALVDVCPLFRGEIWACVLGVRGDIAALYRSVDKDTMSSTDRQIDVDIPRCHQYHTLLSSSEGHRKFKRLLKCWVVSHPGLVYWQGLDSLCAPFLSVNFNNEALAYSCLSAFIDKFLHKFFLKDNSPVMQEYLALFNQLIAFHDPVLFNHLDSIGFYPDLYAIPWFLTMFTHILPLEKIWHLWDTLLLGDSSFPLCVGLAVLLQFRAELLSFDFNECILMFSDLPDIDIQQCVQDSMRLFKLTPPSSLLRCHAPLSDQGPAQTGRRPLSLSALKQESCLRISAGDLISMCRLECPQVPLHTGEECVLPRGKRGRAVVVDIRAPEDWRQGHLPGSLSVPQEFNPDGSLTAGQAALTRVPRGRVMVVLGQTTSAPVFARQLVRLDRSRVCVLDGGAGVLRTLGLLSAINNEP